MLNTLELRNFFSASPASVKNKRQIAAVPAKPWQTALGLFLVAINLGLGISFIAGVNNNAAQGFVIKSLQQKKDQLTEENKKLSIKASEVSSIVEIQNQLAGSDFVPVTGASFLQVNQFTQR